jgi:2-methylcitrate dehydratase PrpD
LIGVEGSIRFGQWLGRPHYQIGFHQTATAGAVGATLAAIRLLGLTEDVARNALGLAATRASGLKSQFGTMANPTMPDLLLKRVSRRPCWPVWV